MDFCTSMRYSLEIDFSIKCVPFIDSGWTGQGHRAPYLQTGADSTYLALESLSMAFDSSLPTRKYMEPPLWPYTLDFGDTQLCTFIDFNVNNCSGMEFLWSKDCLTKPCPTGNYSGLWNVPVVANIGLDGGFCHMHDSCIRPNTSEETFDYLYSNLQRHRSNRAPFGVYIHATWFVNNTPTFDGYLQFIDYLTTLDHVYIVTVSQGLDWIRNPQPLDRLQSTGSLACPPPEAASCEARDCRYTTTDPPGGGRTMRSCVPCPDIYPWLGNPTGNSTPRESNAVDSLVTGL